MRLRFHFLILAFSFHLLAQAQKTLSLLFIGDVMQHEPQITSAFDGVSKTYEYDHCFQYIRQAMADADITIANLEVTLAGKPYSGYPMFSAPDALAAALKNAGVDILVTANNHTCDKRKKGVIRTLDVLDSLEIIHTGSFRNKEEKEQTYPLLIEEKGFRLALLNYTYGLNGMPIDPPTMVNLIEEAAIKADLAKAKSMQVDKIIAFMHWGLEYTHVPSKEQLEAANWLFDNGADIVMGAHPHVLQPMYFMEKDNREQLLVYSLGNFISDQRTAPRDGGAMFRMELARREGIVFIENPGYMLTWVWRPTVEGKRRYYVMPADQFETDRQHMDVTSHTLMKKFTSNMRTLLNEKNEGVKEYKYDPELGWILK